MGRASRPATGTDWAVQEITFLKFPASRRGQGDQRLSLVEMPCLSPGQKTSERLPRLANCATEVHAPDPKVNLSAAFKNLGQGDSVKSLDQQLTVNGHGNLWKNSPEATTAREDQVKKRTRTSLSKTRKPKTPASLETRQHLDQEVAMDTENPRRKGHQQKPVGNLRKDNLGGEGEGSEIVRHLQKLYRQYKCIAPLEENTFLQGKKIKPHYRSCLLAGEEPLGQGEMEEKKAFSSREKQHFSCENTKLMKKARSVDQNLLAGANLHSLTRRKIKSLETARSHPDRESGQANTKRRVQLSSHNVKQGASERNAVRPKWQPREEGWAPTIQGIPVILSARGHTYLPK